MALLISILLFWTMAPQATGGGGNDGYGISKGSPEISLSLLPAIPSDNAVKLGYVIPYAGYIEFHLFDAKGTKIWVDYYVREKGTYYQSLRKDKLTAGQQYSYQFWYKGKPYEGKFTA